MRIKKSLLFSLVAASLLMLVSVCAFAQATRTWVSGVGDDVNPCSRTAPCKTFAGAISKTAAAGEINCIDSGAYGAVTITKSITISCEDVEAGVLHSATNGIVINAAATDNVVLRGLDINGGTPSAGGLNGIRFLAGGSLTVDDCLVHSSVGASPNGFGIFIGNSSLLAKVQILNSKISGNGAGTGGGGIQLSPTATGSVDLTVTNTVLLNNTVGLRADSAGTSGSIDVNVVDSTASGAPYHGFVALGGGGPVRMMLNRVNSSNNLGEGVRSAGAGALVRISSSVITGNGSGLVTSGGVIQSYGNNLINGNGVDGTATPVTLK
ncbi:MAG TPA: hypothetical protein VN017_06570 [Pseudoxanthomonas sp.]|nr:hypothetical protein [Pseudoxanthomonas sp.]